MTTDRQLASWARKAREATARRDELIRSMHDEGRSLRVIGEHAQLSHTAVRKILERGQGKS